MSVEGIILHHGEAGGVTLHKTRVDYLLTAQDSKHCSLFEFTIAPGFNTGAHYHTKIEELFYVLEGELDLAAATRPCAAAPGPSCSCRPARRTHSVIPVLSRAVCCWSRRRPDTRNTSMSCAIWSPKAASRIPRRSPSCARKYDTVQLATLTPG